MTILSIIQDATDELSSLARPSAIVASTEREVQRLLTFAHITGDRIIQKYDWPSCVLQGTISLVAGTATYALPGDFERLLSNTHWDGANHWMLIGPYTPQEWQALKRGVSTNIPRKAFRIHSNIDNKIDLHPVPGAGETGNILYYEYVSKSWCLPIAWEATPTPWTSSTSFAAQAYCSSNGNVYQTLNGGTTGSTAPSHTTTTASVSDGGVAWFYIKTIHTFSAGDYCSYNGNIYKLPVGSALIAGTIPPTHTSGMASDGNLSWAYANIAHNRFLSDTDTSLIDEKIMTLGIIWRYLRSIGNEYQDAKDEFDDAVEKAYAGFQGSRILDFNRVRNPIMIGPWNIPDTFN